jgi:hypothetical protein
MHGPNSGPLYCQYQSKQASISLPQASKTHADQVANKALKSL